MEVAGKVAIVTGASEGIGLATARLFAKHGAKIALAARSAGKLAHIAAELPGSFSVPTDMRDDAAVRRLVNSVHERYGRIDILVNNAGQGMHVPIEQAELDQYRSILELNVVSVLGAMQAVIPVMRRQGGGVIVNVSSGTSKMIIPGVGPYSSTKYALNAITLTARLELAKDNIRVGLVYPYITRTDFMSNAIAAAHVGDRESAMSADSPEDAARKILEAVETEAAETFADRIKPQVLE